MRFQLLHKKPPLLKLRGWVFFFFLLLAAGASAQNVTLNVHTASLESVFNQIKRQTGYSFVYTSEGIKGAKPVSITVSNSALAKTLELLFRDQPLTYSIQQNYVVVNEKTTSLTKTEFEIRGRVVDENGEGIIGASVKLKGGTEGTATGDEGNFLIRTTARQPILLISCIGYEPREEAAAEGVPILIRLKAAVNKLDEQLIIAYGTVSNRLNTGNVFKLSSDEIAKQPVSNLLSAMEGRVPGLVISQSSGIPGSSFKVQLRGQSSIGTPPGTSGFLPADNPLFIVDGVPFEAGNLPSNLLNSAAGNGLSAGLSALNSINPSDVESIEVLKDADATAIYGSRGANGVILITTKRARSGKASVNFSLTSGISGVTRTMNMLSTPDYVRMRKEAFANDATTMTATNAPDIVLWDTTRYTDLKKVFYHRAHYTDIQAAFSDGNEFTQFRLGAGFNQQTNVFSENLYDRRGSLHFDVNHLTRDKKWNIELTGFYSTDENKLISLDLTQYLKLPPNIKLYDSLGNLNWSEGGVFYSSLSGGTNPLAELLKRYTATTDNLNSNLQLSYRPSSHLELKTSFGYNSLSTDEVKISPRASLSPASSILASSSFGNSRSSSWIIEPQLNYQAMIRKSKLSLLLGSTFQNRSYTAQTINANNYTSDLLLYSLAAAGTVSASNTEFLYRYMAVFGRLNYNIQNKYLINLSARRDGSSRFGPDKRFSNFGAIGGAWLFSSENWFSKNLPFISYGKLRLSYGVTGNDQIGEYRYLDLWNSVPVTYQGQPGLSPNNLFNPDYSWEINKKAEMGLDLGFLNNRIGLSASYFRNRSGNQLINYTLPVATGFNSVIKNFPALVQNEGLEGVLNARVISGTKFNWSSSVNITIPKNKLIAFPGLASTGYASFLKIGQPLSNIIRYRYLGVDPATGVYQFEDIDKDGKVSSPNDFQPVGNTDPKFYGGWQNDWRYKGFELSVFFEFKRQRGKNYLALFYTTPPGLIYNQPQIVLDRWQKPGDVTNIQKFTQLINVNNPAYGALVQRINNSDAIYSDASFVRCKNVSLSYTLPVSLLKKLKASSTIFLQGQNLFVLTKYLGSDPETQNVLVMPPLRTVAGGIKLQF